MWTTLGLKYKTNIKFSGEIGIINFLCACWTYALCIRSYLPDPCTHTVSAQWVCSLHLSVPYAYAQHVVKVPFQVRNLYAYAECTLKEQMRMLSYCISSWCVCSEHARISSWFIVCLVHAWVPDVYAQWTHTWVSDAYAQPTHKLPMRLAQSTHEFLMSMLSVCISSLCVCAMHSLVPDAYAQHTH